MALQIREVKSDPWYTDFANYLATRILPGNLTSDQRRKFFKDLKYYFWDEPSLLRSCVDGIIRRCVFGDEINQILEHCHKGEAFSKMLPNC